jgi:hypothetical protein
MPNHQEGQAALNIFLDVWVTGTTDGDGRRSCAAPVRSARNSTRTPRRK